jgi:hypothetical protein
MCLNRARSNLQARCYAPNVGRVNGKLLLRNPRRTDLIVIPKTHSLDVNPDSPNVASSIAKAAA